MIKVWVCILIFGSPTNGSSYGPAVATVTDLATVADCHRVGKSWMAAGNDRYYAPNKYRCVEVLKHK